MFALYGEASSNANKKNGAELQSQFVEIGTEPFVSLTFSEKNGTEIDFYTVKRIPRHVRPLKRGSGEKMVSEEVSLTMPDGSEYPAKETDAKLMEIVGLTKEQFMQVAMIAQGEFMELLRAKSDDKKMIFTPVCTRRSKMNLPYAKKKNRQRSIRSACGVLPRSAAQNFRKVWNRRHF